MQKKKLLEVSMEWSNVIIIVHQIHSCFVYLPDVILV